MVRRFTWVTLMSAALVLAACGSDSSPNASYDGGLDAAAADAAAADAAAPDAAAPEAAPADAARDGGGPPVLPEDLPEPLPTGAPSAAFITYNVGLAPTVKGSAQRLPLIVDAVNAADADVLCLEEVWKVYTSQAAFAQAVAATFPYAFWSEDTTKAMGTGVLIVSKHPLFKGRALKYVANPETYFDNVVLGVDVVTPTSHFRVLCTHLAPGLDSVGVGDRSAQITELATWAQTQGYLDGPTVLLGDFNMGPDPIQACTPTTTPACTAPDVTSYDLVRQTFTDANEGWAQCTWCRDICNPLQVSSLFLDEPDQRIDHCFVTNLGAATLQSRAVVFDAVQRIPFGSGTLEHLSDHLGVRCAFGP
ncbi:MAG TPA: endonuclease/exonuclease/phosphatase family protein [Polyangia bacterium]|jgi:endonuclease/exonuclease/phosphatase family metal-dependent hydrolase